MSPTAELRSDVLRVLAAFEPTTMTAEAAILAVQDFSTIEKAAATGRMFAALQVAKTNAWRGQGYGSAADWLAAKAGITVREAAMQLGTATKAQRLPKTKEEMRKGNLSPTQAGAVTLGASANPAEEDELLHSARNDTTAALKAKAAKTRAATEDTGARERRIRSERSGRKWIDADGAFNLSLRGPATDGVRLDALLKPFEEQVFRTGRTHGARDSYENRSYDAFFAMIEHLRAAAAAPPAAQAPADAEKGTHADRTGPADPAGQTNPTGQADPAGQTSPTGPTDPADVAQTGRTAKVPGGNNVKVIVRIDHTALRRGHTIGGETCEVAGLGPISVSTARELMGDAFLAAVITKGKDVVTVAHLGRGLNAHQRTAIEAMGLRCSNLACNRTVGIQIDHRHPYAQDPVTKLDNQDPLCPNCHRLKTHHGWQLEPGRGPRRFLRPDRPVSPAAATSSRSGPRSTIDRGSSIEPGPMAERAARAIQAARAGRPRRPAEADQPSLL